MGSASSSAPSLPAHEISRALLGWHRGHGRTLSFRGSRDPYEVLVAEVMLRKTTARQVDRVWLEFIARFPDPGTLAKASVAEVERVVAPLGMRRRALDLVAIARAIATGPNEVLSQPSRLAQLPGVGEYIANCVAVFCYGKRLPLIDSNVRRVLTRLLSPHGDGAGLPKEELERAYLSLCQGESIRDFHYALLDLAAFICRPKKPACDRCPLSANCAYYRSGRSGRSYWKNSVIVKGRVERWSGAKILRAAGLEEGEVTLVAGGLPCQPFSKSAFWSPLRWKYSGRRRRFQGLQDPRARLLGEFVRIVRKIKPVAYVMENVPGLAYRTSRPMLESVLRGLRSAGYTTSWRVLDAADYGVPQKRKRLFIIGARNGVQLAFPRPTHCSKSMLEAHPDLKPHVTAGEAIGDLDDGAVREDERVGGKWGHLLPLIPPGDNYLFFTKERGHPNPIFRWRSRYWSFLLKLSPSMPAWTIQARPGPYTGPFHWRNRRLRIEEIKRLQAFPDDYQIYGDRREAQRQLGEAVPPLLAQRIGEAIRQQLSGST